MIESLQKIQMSTQELSRFQQAIDKFSLQFLSIPILNGQIVALSVVNGANEVSHGLSQTPQGFFVISKSANVDIWGDTFTQKTITIQSNGAANIKIWVF